MDVGTLKTINISAEILIILEGNATVGGGGLYTVGAWNYIVPTAVKDIVSQLQSWAGTASDTDGVGIN